jgi:UDP-N-acetyl-D-glucosamine dehydrogenase
MYYELLRAKIADGSAVCGVVGLGYVGLPLAVEMGNVDLNVIGFDVSKRVVNDLNGGKSHIKDIPSADVARLRKSGRFEATTDMSRLAECDVISICVPTPLSKTKDPEMSYVIAATESVAAALRPGQLIVLESTTYPGTTRELMIPLLQARGLESARTSSSASLRSASIPGTRSGTPRTRPKVIGGVTPHCVDLGAAIYGKFIERMVPVSSPEAPS